MSVTTETSASKETWPFQVAFPEAMVTGHFAAWEQPQLFSEEIRAAFRSLR